MAGEFSKTDISKAVERVFWQASQGKVPAEHPKAYILGGQPGAGKTVLQKELLKECGHNAIVVNGDEYRKLIPGHEQLRRLPGVKYASATQEFANQVTEGLIERASSMSYNLIIEGTLRRKEPALNTCRLLQEKGYKAELCVMAVNREVSYYSTKLRAENLRKFGGVSRQTATDNHNEVVKKLPRNVSEIYQGREFDNIRVFGRQGDCLYSQEETPETDPGYIVQDKLYGRTPEDARQVRSIKKSIAQIQARHIQPPQLGL